LPTTRERVEKMGKHDEGKDEKPKPETNGHKPGGPIPPPADPGKHGKK
jgi:hypothetical protein